MSLEPSEAKSRARATRLTLALAALLAAHAFISIWFVSETFYRRVRFAEWWLQADAASRARHLFRPEYAELIERCRAVIPPGNRVLVRTDGFPWLLNYYLYPIELYQETTVPEANHRVFLPSPRQLAYPPRKDIAVSWIIEDYSRESVREQQLIRVPSEVESH